MAAQTELRDSGCSELWRRYKDAGDERARERLVLSYAPLVKYVAGRMSSTLPSHVEQADLISCGLLGLISAIERFNPDRAIRFESFAMRRIKGAMVDELRSLDWAPRSTRSKARQIHAVTSELERELHRTPVERETAGALGVPVEELQQTRARISNASIAALDEPMRLSSASGDPVSLLERLDDPSAVDPARELDVNETRDELGEAIAGLPERERLVVALYYYENLSLAEIGEVLGVTESRVSQLRAKAVLRLRSPLEDHMASRTDVRMRDGSRFSAV